ncbi:peptidase associated/transthyretin-like domain-containing protein [Winogradskyella bathintestinalis]|uniref:Intradiol ring-cleavage dioxygenases domain-containing protein n=1 Tax=Winogradskyella bathintestinalis TaxID=3035208 RepID=A0ABT7ZX78_9FLAO|nr:hypothetical protein [Winogradskyella bathintestinalis]MDN3493602.1 hypothetical protein [Winogradskyella bathintestinalis]
MKSLILFFCFICFNSNLNPIFAQDAISDLNTLIFDRSEDQLKNTDTIPDFRSKNNQLKLTGIIYQSDGVTPASDIILYIEQPDEHGDFELRNTGKDRYVMHRGWVKTDANGRYTFYTFVPGGDRRFNQLQQVHPIVKEPSKDAYAIETFLFDDDPLLTRTCRKRMAKKGDPTRILSTKVVDGILVAERNIVLKQDTASMKS